MLATRQGDHTRVAAHTEYELLALHATSIAECEGISIEKASVANPIEHVHVRGFELGPQLLLFVDRAYDLLRMVQQPNEVHRGRFTLKPVVGELLRFAHQTRSPGEHAGRDAAIVRRDAAHVLALDESDGGAKLAGAQCCCYPGRSAADHDHLKHLLPRFRAVLACQASSTKCRLVSLTTETSSPSSLSRSVSSRSLEENALGILAASYFL